MARSTTLTAALVALLALTACTSPPPAPAETPERAVSAPEPVVVPVGEVARGELVSPDGSTSGSITVNFDGDGYFARLEDYETTYTGALSLGFTDELLAPGDCAYEKYQTAFALGSPWPDGEMRLEYADPSFFDTAVVIYYPTGSPIAGECWEKGAAWAELEWDLPDERPWLTVTDGGVLEGAQGEVALTGSGEPLSYWTATGDQLSQIAQRFGITVADLVYLNPGRRLSLDPTMAYAEETLNLSKDARRDIPQQ
ncbi:LysM domain-containing protein [Glaciihabitans arcticus]|uniref:LysM domain-containing protein n=1 Tax=Glaciihabitans arcticus TaxID=2668039 RepID=A0A4Q9GQ96_9MICO|nr:LysM domain-containing protein [Glaciihabitans arcticus]TBN56144.1 LysM domain-containing protein [Glaciihabitans arcticus]